jgi:hypothetical protein
MQVVDPNVRISLHDTVTLKRTYALKLLQTFDLQFLMRTDRQTDRQVGGWLAAAVVIGFTQVCERA